jgi:hypothetical protein
MLALARRPLVNYYANSYSLTFQQTYISNEMHIQA